METDIDLWAELRKHDLLEQLMRRQIVAEVAGEEELTDEEIDNARNQYYKNNNLSSDESIKTFLKTKSWSDSNLEWQATLPMRIKRYCDKHYRLKAESSFLKRKNQLDQVIYSLLRTKDGYLARELYIRIKEGEASFGDLASSFSEGPERYTKGIVGPVPLCKAHPVLSEALRTTQPGRVMKPIKVGEFWIVAQLEKHMPATFDEAVSSNLSYELFQEWVNGEVARKMHELTEEQINRII